MTDSSKYWNAPLSELSSLNTRHLLALLKASRRRHVCSCSEMGMTHCGDDVLDDQERIENRLQFELQIRIKLVLKTRPHVKSSRESKARTARNFGKREKKTLRYSRTVRA